MCPVCVRATHSASERRGQPGIPAPACSGAVRSGVGDGGRGQRGTRCGLRSHPRLHPGTRARLSPGVTPPSCGPRPGPLHTLPLHWPPASSPLKPPPGWGPNLGKPLLSPRLGACSQPSLLVMRAPRRGACVPEPSRLSEGWVSGPPEQSEAGMREPPACLAFGWPLVPRRRAPRSRQRTGLGHVLGPLSAPCVLSLAADCWSPCCLPGRLGSVQGSSCRPGSPQLTRRMALSLPP